MAKGPSFCPASIDVFPGDRRNQIQVQLASSLVGVIYQRLLPRVGSGLVAAYEVLVANGADVYRDRVLGQLENWFHDSIVSVGESRQELNGVPVSRPSPSPMAR